jgi:hypothetical protein
MDNCDNTPRCSAWNPQGPLVNSNAFDGGPALSDVANNVACQDTSSSGPVCRDLYLSKRTKLTGAK